ncbi:hypothetical protein HDV05_007509 [Chytridiales sp. JEL 0842]|nr:hypothetical protein HDV05_007509 [Chytridiales sp. JEL 0842]
MGTKPLSWSNTHVSSSASPWVPSPLAQMAFGSSSSSSSSLDDGDGGSISNPSGSSRNRNGGVSKFDLQAPLFSWNESTRDFLKTIPGLPAGYIPCPILLSQYTPQQPLGMGASGFVLSGTRNSDGLEVAIKFMFKEWISPVTGWKKDRGIGRLVPVEVFVLRRLNHENVVRFIDVFEDNSFFYIIMESVKALSLPAPIPQTAPVIAQDLTESPLSWKSSGSDSACTVDSSSSRGAPGPRPHVQLPDTIPTTSFTSPSLSIPTSPPAHLLTLLSPFAQKITASPTSSPCAPTPASSPTKNPKPAHPAHPAHLTSTSRRPSQDLFECIQRFPHMPELLAWSIFRQITDAVGYLHARGFVHLDLKDENLIIDSSLCVKLIDFGCARTIPHSKSEWFEGLVGTKMYAAPEVVFGRRYRGPEQDVWSLGVVLYVLVEARMPFTEAQILEMGKEQEEVEQEREENEEEVGEVKKEGKGRVGRKISYRTLRSNACRDLIGRMLEVDVEKRITMDEVAKHRWIVGGSSSNAPAPTCLAH